MSEESNKIYRKNDYQTQMLTLGLITDLCVMRPVLRLKFGTPEIISQIKNMHNRAAQRHFDISECQDILDTSRKTLTCIDDNGVTRLLNTLTGLILMQVVDLRQRHDYIWSGVQGDYYAKENSIMIQLLELCS